MLERLRGHVLDANLELVRRGLVLYTFGNVSGIDRSGAQPLVVSFGLIGGGRRDGNTATAVSDVLAGADIIYVGGYLMLPALKQAPLVAALKRGEFDQADAVRERGH